MFKKDKDRLPIYKPADCLGESCAYFSGDGCNARMELLDATGLAGGTDKAPYIKESSYALYGRVCMGGNEQVVVGLSSSSPNGQASAAEMIGRAGLYEDQRIILNTPADEVKF
jgi:hypothetical protein